MSPAFDDPEIAALYRYLTGAGETPAAGQRRTPAHMPRRVQRPQSAGDIARAEGLELGDLAPTPRTKRPRNPRPARRSTLRVVLDGLVEAGCTRQEAAELAPQWLEAQPSPEGVWRWIDAVGIRQPRVAAQLRLQGLCADDLDVHIDGTTARQRLHNGESIGQIVGSLLALRQPLA